MFFGKMCLCVFCPLSKWIFFNVEFWSFCWSSLYVFSTYLLSSMCLASIFSHSINLHFCLSQWKTQTYFLLKSVTFDSLTVCHIYWELEIPLNIVNICIMLLHMQIIKVLAYVVKILITFSHIKMRLLESIYVDLFWGTGQRKVKAIYH
jgi:hypothetical protein